MKKYIAIFETSAPPLPEKEYSPEELKKVFENPHLYMGGLTFNNPEPAKHYINVEISEETFQFINNVANIEKERYGEKVYVINNIKFWINEE